MDLSNPRQVTSPSFMNEESDAESKASLPLPQWWWWVCIQGHLAPTASVFHPDAQSLLWTLQI